ncbi:MAG TPA: NADH-quinone oxidoreductase subunit J [Anaerolineaceae bacterium]|nr:NADH-quinone oxidoreductase subunit J [Anaerolineaceae bacterium]
MLYILIVIGIIICAVQAIRSFRLLVSALWLAGTSALVALLMFLLGAPEVAVIELSVGAGLVTVLFVFAINLTGHEKLGFSFVIPRPVSIGLIALAVLLLGYFILPNVQAAVPALSGLDFQTTLWQSRALDMFLQVVLIFAGVLGVLGFLGSKPQAKE